MTVTVTKLVSDERAQQYVGLGRWAIVSTSNSGTLIRWSGSEHERPPEPETDWDRMWGKSFDRPELVGENGNPDFYRPVQVLRGDAEAHQTVRQSE